MESYIVAFFAGSSGRFIANLIWGLINDTPYEYNLTEFNSTHNFSPYAVTVDMSDVPVSSRMFSSDLIYDYFKFVSDPAIIVAHAYPKFDSINERFPDTKIVMISYTEDDIYEITSNSLVKNGYESIIYNRAPNNESIFLLKTYKEMFGVDFSNQEISMSDKKEIFDRQYKRVFYELSLSKYMDPVVPKEFIDKTLILKYKDMCNDRVGTLEKLCKFTNRPLKDSMVKLYDSYLLGREKLIAEHLPWLDK